MSNKASNLDIANLEDKLAKAFDDFEKGQVELADGLRENPNQYLNSLPKWSEVRQRQCAVIQFLLEHLRQEIERHNCPVDIAQKWQDRLASIISKETELQELLSEIKSYIKSQMNETLRGRKMLSKYRTGNVSHPVYLNTDA